MAEESFRGRLAKRVGSTGTSIVLALDLVQGDDETAEQLTERSLEVLTETAESVCAVKLNVQLLLPLGLLGGVSRILDEAHKLGLLTIMDAKINDVGHTNTFMARRYYEAGFDAVIANPLVGWEEGLQGVFEEAAKHRGGVILLAYLSHKAAGEGYGLQITGEAGPMGPLSEVFLERAVRWKADGVVVGATHLEKVQEAARFLRGRIPIYSPGVGAQGGSLEATLAAGTTYPIIGRSIVEAENPGQAARTFRESVMRTRNLASTRM